MILRITQTRQAVAIHIPPANVKSSVELEGTGGCWRALESTRRYRTKDQKTSSLVRKCANIVALSVCYDVTVIWESTIVSDSQDFWKIKSMHKHFPSLFPCPLGSSHQNTHFHTKCSQLKLNLKYWAVGGHWRVQEIKARIERTSLLVRKCADGVVVSIRYDVTVVQIVHNFWKIKSMCKQWIPGSLFPHPPRAWVWG